MQMQTGTVADARDSYLDKPDWVPTDEESDYLAKLKAEWTEDWQNFSRSFDFFQRKNLQSYMAQNEEDSYLLARQTRKEPWRSNTRRQSIREKLDAVMAAVADLNLQPEVQTYSVHGKNLDDMADAMEVLLEHAGGLDESDKKDKLSVLYLLTHGTVSEDVSWVVRNRANKRTKFDPSTGKITSSWEGKPEPAIEQIWTSAHPLNRILLADVTQPFIHLQPHKWAEYVMPYDIADTMFGSWKNWKFVKPNSATDDEWTNVPSQTQVEETSFSRMVRLRIYENVWRNEYAVIAGSVLMTPPGLTMQTDLKDLAYSHTWTQLFPFSPHFAYGQSFVQRMHNDAALLDFFYNALVDKARQGIEPPLVSSYRTISSRNMFKPGTVSQGDVQMKPLVTHQGVSQPDMGMIEYIEKNLDKASTPPQFQGASGESRQTAYAYREQQKAALRTMWNVFSAVADMKKQRSELMLRLILEHYPKLGVATLDGKVSDAVGGLRKIFSVKGTMGDESTQGVKEVSFAPKLPQESGDAAMDLKSMMLADEERASVGGKPVKKILVDADVAKQVRHCVQVIINPSDRKSKKADKAEIRDEYALYNQNPAIDQAWAARVLLIANGRDPEEGVAKAPPPQQQPQQGQPQDGTPGVPGAIPEPATAQTGNPERTQKNMASKSQAAGVQ